MVNPSYYYCRRILNYTIGFLNLLLVVHIFLMLKFECDSSINVDGLCVSEKDIRDVADRKRFLPAKVYTPVLTD